MCVLNLFPIGVKCSGLIEMNEWSIFFEAVLVLVVGDDLIIRSFGSL